MNGLYFLEVEIRRAIDEFKRQWERTKIRLAILIPLLWFGLLFAIVSMVMIWTGTGDRVSNIIIGVSATTLAAWASWNFGIRKWITGLIVVASIAGILQLGYFLG